MDDNIIDLDLKKKLTHSIIDTWPDKADLIFKKIWLPMVGMTHYLKKKKPTKQQNQLSGFM